ncbi:MAG: hypothetical protein G01um101430_140 [Parcubacteria group bacterium Gr01-1014_30]|nr:MAG: hypothetical protein G01um101430_140 [Parcubacteria group bacterium Gr01-1014_30]
MKFNYQARTKTGEIQSGQVEAVSRDSALNLLRSHKLFITALEEVAAPFYARRLKFFDRIPAKEIVIFSSQLAVMFKSEISPVEVLGTLAKQVKNEQLREKILDMVEKVEGGSPLSNTFALYPEVFSPFYVNMVKSGEATGKLSEIFSYLADYLEKEYEFNRKVKGTMIYPVFLLAVFLAVIGIIIFFVVPQLSQFLAEAEIELSLLTRFLLGASKFLRQWWFLLLLLPLGLAVFLRFYLKTKEGKAFFDKMMLKVPVLGGFLKSIYLSRVSLNLSTLISGGLPIVQALQVTSNVVGNEVYKSIITETAKEVRTGESISATLAKYPEEFFALFVQMVAVGEKTGRLDSSLRSTVDFYQKEVERELDNFMRVLEPALIVFFGLLVGALMTAVIIPVYQIITSF